MKGVKTITGKIYPKVGETNFYEVTEFHKGTVVIHPENIKWKLYHKKEGKWVELEIPVKTGKKVTFNFPQKWYTKELLIEAYIFEAEGKAPPGIIVKPCMGDRKINNTEILNAEGGKITQMPKYGQSITLRATTENMLGEVLKLSLWERDTYSDKGHDPKGNQLLWSGNSKRVNNKGFGEQKIMLSPAMMQLANKSMFEGQTHEYYLLVEADKRQAISQTTFVSSEIVLSKNAPKPKPDTKAQPTPKPIQEQVVVKVKDSLGHDIIKVEGISKAVVGEASVANCDEKYCIKKGDTSELIREINIRLAGFGGNVPTDMFTDRTEKMIKQFQRDYMKIPETGKICGNVLRAIDDFQAKFNFNFESLKCKCGTCSGFGDNKNKGEYLNNKNNIEAYHRYEYPGIHKLLLWSLRAVIFYLDKDGRFSLNKISSGYRCRFHEEYLKKPTTNHMGKALDLHFNKSGERTKKISDLETIRKDIFNKYLGAKWDWKNGGDIFYLESTDVGATTWVHYDVREYSQIYLDDKYFIKTLSGLNAKTILQLAKDGGFQKTCMCIKAKAFVISKPKTSSANKYKWAHSEFGNLIAKKESNNNYNICNKTKGGLKVVNDVKVIETKIKDIVQKQKDRDIFAVGRYQLIPITLNSAISSLTLDVEKNLDEEIQDRIFDEYLIASKRPNIIKYLEKNGNVEDAMYAAAQEWASIGVEKDKRISDKIIKNKKGEIIEKIKRYAEGGESYYAGDGLNKAHITPEEIKEVLINSKNEK